MFSCCCGDTYILRQPLYGFGYLCWCGGWGIYVIASIMIHRRASVETVYDEEPRMVYLWGRRGKVLWSWAGRVFNFNQIPHVPGYMWIYAGGCLTGLWDWGWGKLRAIFFPSGWGEISGWRNTNLQRSDFWRFGSFFQSGCGNGYLLG